MLNGNNESGIRTYERSARMLLLLAVRDVLPGARVRFEHSIGSGVYLNVSGAKLSAEIVRTVEDRMHALSEMDLPIVSERHTREDAMAYFESVGQDDTVRLLKYRPFDHFYLYACDGFKDYFYGDMAKSTGEIRNFRLELCWPGMILTLPKDDLTRQPDSYVRRPNLMKAYVSANEESERLGCRNTADLNDLLARGEGRQFIRVCEALHARHIVEIAENIVDRGARVVFVAGPSSSGKTTFANRLSVQLLASGRRPIAVSMDNYYLDRGLAPLDEEGKPDYECPEALNIALFNEQLVQLLSGEAVRLAKYSFKTGMGTLEEKATTLGERDVLIVEGIHGLNEQFSRDIPSNLKYMVYVSALSQLNLDDHNRIRTTDVRLLRRMVRDFRTRNSKVEETMSMWNSVRWGEERYIFTNQENADVMFNTSLLYEIAVLKKYAYPMLKSVPKDSPWYERSRRLTKFLHYFGNCDLESEIPPTSILREFIGGCSFYGEDA